jgi:hypothetical protein
MLLAHHLWEQTPAGGVCEPEQWLAALAAAMDEQDDALRATWDSFAVKEQAVFGAIAAGDPVFGARTLERFNLSKGGAQHARDALAYAAHVQRIDGTWRPVDPLLARWAVQLQHNGGKDPLR